MSGKRARLTGLLGALAIGMAAVAARAAPADPEGGPLVAAYNSCGQQLFRSFAEKPGNIVLSPYSIGTAMSMVFAGARGANEAEMAKVLGLEFSQTRV